MKTPVAFWGYRSHVSLLGVLTQAMLLAVLASAAHQVTADAEQIEITVRADRPGPPINPNMWGIFFEDINFGADGGLYAELVKNRSFEFPDPTMGWTPTPGEGRISIRRDSPFNAANANYLQIECSSSAGFGVVNEGFRGMGIKAGEKYDVSLQGRSNRGDKQKLKVELVGQNGEVLAGASAGPLSENWKLHTTTLAPRREDAKARLRLALERPGVVQVDMVSLFPRKTWKNRPGGLRTDMVQMLADLKPGFLRFPGGCIVEGRYLTNRYAWKTTIGPIEERKLIINRWNDEFKHRPTPDYYQSFGLGFYEFFQLCEDIGAEPMPILNCGMACQFNSSELAPLDTLQPFIQDALDLIEFANGSPETQWGARRAALGHRAPFNLKMLGVGNEQWGEQYFERYALFAKALKEKHPEILLISSAGPAPADERFNLAWKKLRELCADIIDEHCYAAPRWFLENAHRYDDYDRNGPKVFMGEYAAQSVAIARPDNRNNLECALAEAAYMTGMERNADVVRLASYAPLFGHTEGWQWTPDLIWCDNLRVFATPNYYVQQLFSLNRGDEVVPISFKGQAANGQNATVFATVSRDVKRKELILKIVNAGAEKQALVFRLEGVQSVRSNAEGTVLAGSPADENSIEHPRKVAPESFRISNVSTNFEHQFAPYSLTVLRLKLK